MPPSIRQALSEARAALLEAAQACSSCKTGPDDEYCCRKLQWDAIARIDALTPEQPDPPEGWVSVEEELPEKQGEYLTCDDTGRQWLAYYSPHLEAWSVHDGVTVMHWMQKPAAPAALRQQEIK